MKHGGDPADAMLEQGVEELTPRVAGRTTVHFGLGRGRIPLAASNARAEAVWCADRRFPVVTAARRAVADVPDTRLSLVHAHGAQAFSHVRDAAVATVRITDDRLSTQQLVHDAFGVLAVGGTCLLAGGNTEGVKPAARLLESLFGAARLEAQHGGHRMLSATKRAETPVIREALDSAWLDHDAFRIVDVRARGRDWRLFTRPGVFSWEHPDEATMLLADVFEVRPGESVLDIGCGAGLLGMIAAHDSSNGRVLLLDADADAVRGAQRAVAFHGLANARVAPSDVTSGAGDERFDVVVSNPPFHAGRAVDLTLPLRFIREAHERLVPGGRLYLVANRTLPYEREIAHAFGNVRTLHDGRRFKVLGATR